MTSRSALEKHLRLYARVTSAKKKENTQLRPCGGKELSSPWPKVASATRRHLGILVWDNMNTANLHRDCVQWLEGRGKKKAFDSFKKLGTMTAQ